MSLLLRFLRLVPFAGIAAVPALSAAACNAQISTVLNSDAGPDSGSPASCKNDPECNDDPTISSLRGKCTNGVCVCNPGTIVTASGKCGDPTTTPDGGTKGDCEAKGGTCIGPDQTPPPTYRQAKPGEGTCTNGNVCWVPVETTPAVACTTDPDCNNDKSVSTLWGSCYQGICVCNMGFHVQPNGKCDKPLAPDCQTQKGTCRQQPATCLAGEMGSDSDTDYSCGDLIEAVCCQSAKLCKGPQAGFTCCHPNDAAEPPICVNGWKTCRPGLTASNVCG